MYDRYYGFGDRPFQLTPDARFWFESKTHRTAMAYLGYGLSQGEGFIVITGDVGAGKTTLVGHLMRSIDPQRLHALRLVSTQVEGEDMLRLTAQQLGLATEGLAKAQLLDRIERTLRLHASEGRQTLLIVDEAQNLPLSALEELRMLSNFQNGGQSLLQIFLLGQPEFRERFETSQHLEQLRQRVIATHHLTPMEAEEIAPYIQHRLKLVGWQNNPSFTEDAWAALYRHSGGVPRRLNVLAGRVLLHGSVEGLSRIDGATVDLVAADQGEERAAAAEGAPQRRRAADAAPPTEAAPVRIVTAQDPALLDRIAELEERLDEQEAALRRVLGLLIDWVEREEPATQHYAR
ncbi:AAA family ATPase [Sphingomonas sp. CGMCC 1.13654]|uniref:AAA family ATPase n=1 Tax=Sphingomonas chungangi TaxID=2683589 RepID=A0A838LAC6_9SPHN|nr:XrtA/PEP-CTERM system-associated ATPase [Sphingomonas chungangi]MBA2935840.1 AAA family ATPase [Sphingomonas chungangi]MVW54531.1 AAA family ATPase [Sphingomonas chungangi]